MESSQKKHITNYFVASKGSAGLDRKTPSMFPYAGDEVHTRLATVGRAARKAVSDGYKVDTALPSYRGMTVGPVNPGSFTFTRPDGSVISSVSSLDSPSPIIVRPNDKRSFADEGDTDGDTEPEDNADVPMDLSSRPKAVPRNHRSRQRQAFFAHDRPIVSQETDDFADADFLVPDALE